MAARTRLRKCLLFVISSTILLSLSCPPMVVDSFKTGVTRWVSGSFSTMDLTPYTDLIIQQFAGNPSPGI